jgi:glyoxylase-like metal-dependent hydrolase (beta-lactamase superfamily II)
LRIPTASAIPADVRGVVALPIEQLRCLGDELPPLLGCLDRSRHCAVYPTDRSVDIEREGVVMTYEVKLLDILDIELEASFLVLARGMGTTARVKTWSYLILGGDDPIIVDTGASEPEIMERLGMTGIQTPEMTLEAQLGRHGVAMDDIRYVLHTHHHIDHAGQDHRFPKATVVTNRRELEYSASGIMGGQYPPEYVKHHIDRLHTPGALRLLDLELSGPDEILPGIVCEAAGGHTEGSMNINVATADGTACICGDVIYDIQNQIVDPIYQVLDYEPQSTGNQGTSKREERAAIKRALNSGTFVLPIHDWPARVRNGRVLSRLVGDSVPGPEVEIDHRTTSETSEMGLGADYWRPVLAAAP